MKREDKSLEFIGFDLGHGETAVGRAYGGSAREPEILEYLGEKSFVTAVAKKGRDVRIGAQAVNLAAIGEGDKNEIWVKFKSRDIGDKDTKIPTQLFTKTLFADLARDKKILGPKTSQFIVGCPSGWSDDDRISYQALMVSAGLKTVRVVPESRAALMTALEQGYLSLDAARASVLIIDIGSSTTDFTFCTDLEAEDVGHNFLGSGLLDTLIFERCLARQPERAKIEKLIARYPYYRPIMEYWCRLAKEQYFNGEDTTVEMIRRLPVAGGVFFEIRIDEDDAAEILSTEIKALNGFTWPATFAFAMKEAVERLGGRAPETVLLTGGASRLPLVRPACEKAFPDANVVLGAEPEFAIARGLAWLGRFEFLHANFKTAVEDLVAKAGPVHTKAAKACLKLGETLSPVLVDALIDECVLPAFADWRAGKVRTLGEVEAALNLRVQDWLQSDGAQARLRPAIDDWFAGFQRSLENITDPLCRDHGLPAMVLSLDDSAHISRHLKGLSVSAPQVASLENDTALAGTTLSALLIGVILAHANLLAPLLTNPLGLVIGGVIGLGSFLFGKKALEGTIRSSNIPRPLRQIMTNGRVRKAAMEQRADMIKAVSAAWNTEAAPKFTDEFLGTLKTAFLERANERAVLFLL